MSDKKEDGALSPHEGEVTFDAVCRRFPQISNAAANSWRFEGTSRGQRILMSLNRGWWKVKRDFCLGSAGDELLFRMLTKSDGVFPSLLGGSLRVKTAVCYAGKRAEENIRGFLFCYGHMDALFTNRALSVRGRTHIPKNIRYPRVGNVLEMYEEVGSRTVGSIQCTQITGNWP